MFGYCGSSFPERKDDHFTQNGKRPLSPRAEDQLSLKRLPNLSTPPSVFHPTELNATNNSVQPTRQSSSVFNERNDCKEEALRQRREGLLKSRSDALGSIDYRPDPSVFRNDLPSLTPHTSASSTHPKLMAVRKDHSVAGDLIGAPGGLAEPSHEYSDSDDMPLATASRMKNMGTEGTNNTIIEETTDAEGIHNTPSGRPYHCYFGASREGSAIFPDGYQLVSLNKSFAEHEWICSIRDCRALFPSLQGLNVHFARSHRCTRLNDNMDGTLTVIGSQTDLSLSGSIVVSQRPAPASLLLAEPWIAVRRRRQGPRHLAGPDEGDGAPYIQKSQVTNESPPPPAVSDVCNRSYKELDLLQDALKNAQNSDLWHHVKLFLSPSTEAKLTDNAGVSELRALIQILSYPRKKNLKRQWVTEIQNKKRCRLMKVMALLVRAVSDDSSVCDTCSTKNDRSKRCSFLRNIRTEHQDLKQLVGGKCCYCVLYGIKCRMPEVANDHLQLSLSEEVDVSLNMREVGREKLGLILTQAIETKKLSLPPGIRDIAKYVQQCAARVELSIFEIRNDSQDFVSRLNTFCDILRCHGTKYLFLEILHDRLSARALAAMTKPNFPCRTLKSGKSSDCGNSCEDHESTPLPESQKQPSLLSGQHLAPSPSETVPPAAPSPLASQLEPEPSPTGEEAILVGSAVPETFGSVMHRAVLLGMKVKSLEPHERSSMLERATAVLSSPRLDAAQKILKLVATIQKAPIEIRRELYQGHMAVLQVVSPEGPKAAPADWMATVLSDTVVSSELEKDVFNLVVAMRKVRPEDQDGLSQRVLSTFNACL